MAATAVGFPVAENILSQLKTDPSWVIWFVGGVHLLLALFILFKPRYIFAAYFEFQKMESEKKEIQEGLSKKIESCEKDLLGLKARGEAIYVAHLILSLLYGKDTISNDINTQGVKSNLEKLLSPFIQERERVFGFDGPQMYNFAVHLFSEDQQVLIKFLQDRDNRIPDRNRKWKISEGHVGTSFFQKEPLISPDVSKSDVLRKYQSETDNTYYRSMASIPFFGRSGTKEQPIGVFIVTSSKPNQFSESEHLTILRNISTILSNFFILVQMNGWKGIDHD